MQARGSQRSASVARPRRVLLPAPECEGFILGSLRVAGHADVGQGCRTTSRTSSGTTTSTGSSAGIDDVTVARACMGRAGIKRGVNRPIPLLARRQTPTSAGKLGRVQLLPLQHLQLPASRRPVAPARRWPNGRWTAAPGAGLWSVDRRRFGPTPRLPTRAPHQRFTRTNTHRPSPTRSAPAGLAGVRRRTTR